MAALVSILFLSLCATGAHSLALNNTNNTAPSAPVARGGIPGLPGGPWGFPPKYDPHTGKCQKHCLEWRDGPSENEEDGPSRNLSVPWDHFVVAFDWYMDHSREEVSAWVYTQYDDTEQYISKRYMFKCKADKAHGWELFWLKQPPYMLKLHAGNHCDLEWQTMWSKSKWDNLWVEYGLGFEDGFLNVQTDPRCEVYAHEGTKIRCLIQYHFEQDESTSECEGPGCEQNRPAEVGDDAED